MDETQIRLTLQVRAIKQMLYKGIVHQKSDGTVLKTVGEIIAAALKQELIYAGSAMYRLSEQTIADFNTMQIDFSAID